MLQNTNEPSTYQLIICVIKVKYILYLYLTNSGLCSLIWLCCATFLNNIGKASYIVNKSYICTRQQWVQFIFYLEKHNLSFFCTTLGKTNCEENNKIVCIISTLYFKAEIKDKHNKIFCCRRYSKTVEPEAAKFTVRFSPYTFYSINLSNWILGFVKNKLEPFSRYSFFLSLLCFIIYYSPNFELRGT